MTLTLNASPAVIDLLDPLGDLRRVGQLDLSAVPVAQSTNGLGSEWTPKTPSLYFRVCLQRGRLYRKELSPLYFGGYQIKYVALSNERLVREWLS